VLVHERDVLGTADRRVCNKRAAVFVRGDVEIGGNVLAEQSNGCGMRTAGDRERATRRAARGPGCVRYPRGEPDVAEVEPIRLAEASHQPAESQRTLQKQKTLSRKLNELHEPLWKKQARRQKGLWLRLHPGRTAMDYDELGEEKLLWQQARGQAAGAAEKQERWQRRSERRMARAK
jgi:hypothetical protein